LQDLYKSESRDMNVTAYGVGFKAENRPERSD